MTNEEILEGNKLIAEFMGQQGHSCKDAYSENWNALMPVVEKIEENHKTVIATSDWGDKHYMNIITGVGLMKSTVDNPSKFMGTGKTKIEAVLRAAVEFIKWYNNQKS